MRENLIRKHYWFSGRVQGVGFRYRACYIASSLGVTGWVRNNWDDRVEMEAQGSRELLAMWYGGVLVTYTDLALF